MIDPRIALLVIAMSGLTCRTDSGNAGQPVLPHNLDSTSNPLTSSDLDQLSHAVGKTAELVGMETMTDIFAERQSGLKIGFFWNTDCDACLALLKKLAAMKLDEKAHFVVVTVAEQTELPSVNARIREAGLTGEVFWISRKNFLPQKIEPKWNGAMPALLIANPEEELRLFYQQQFAEGELDALLQPFFL
jgi:hypothetical protein